MLPMLAVRADAPPTGPDWVHEVKWDGMRALADIRDGRLHLTTRIGRSATDRFPELARLALQYDDLLLDGELCVFDHGIPSFAALADRIHVKDRATALAIAQAKPVTYVIFDVLRVLGTDVSERPWHERRELLERLDLRGPRWQVSPTHDDGAALLAATAEQGLEGVVSKRRGSTYQPGRRSRDWIKVPHRPLFSLVVGGWRPETGNVNRVGSLLLGYPGPDGLRFMGRVGSGLAVGSQVDLLAELHPRVRADSPFAEELPREDALGATWVEPEIVVDVRALGLAGQGKLRQPSYQHLRPDLTPADLTAEATDVEESDIYPYTVEGGDGARG